MVVERAHPFIYEAGTRAHCAINGMVANLDLDEYIQRRIYYRCHEIPELRWMARFLRPGDHVADVGANVGLFTLLAAGQVGSTGQVYAIEPVPANADALERNLALNPLTSVRVHRVAAGAAAGTTSLGLSTDEPGSRRVSGDYTEGAPGAQVTVPVVPLSNILSSAPRLRVIKMDVEGTEPRALAGLTETFRKAPPDALLLEVNPSALRRQGFKPDDVVEPLIDAGYNLRGISPQGSLRRFRPPPNHRVTNLHREGGTWAAILNGFRGVDRVESVVAIRA